MKIKPEHFKYIEHCWKKVPIEKAIAHKKKLQDEGNYNPERMAWDFAWSAKISSSWLTKVIYSYSNDEHLTTVYKKLLYKYLPE